MLPEDELKALIESQLLNICETNLPRLCLFCKSDEGKETATTMIFEYCMNEGVSVQAAMAHIDSDL